MIVNVELLLAFLGIIATIVIGIWGIRYASKQKVKTQLLFIEHNCISLFKSIVKELEDIEIKYKDKVIDENLIMFKGTLFNSGNSDIDKSIIHKPLSISLPSNYTWTKAKIIDKSIDVVINDSIENNHLVFNWDILKENEYFTFDSIIEYKPTPDNKSNSDDYDITRELSRNIDFNHRITNLKSIIKEKIPSKPMSLLGLIFLSLYLLSIVGVCLYFAAGQFVFPEYDLQFKIQRENFTSFVKLKAVDENKIELINKKGDNIFTATKEELYLLSGNNIEIVKQDISYERLLAVGTFAMMMMIGFIIMISEAIGERQLYKRVKLIADKHSNFRLDVSYRSIRHRLFPFR